MTNDNESRDQDQDKLRDWCSIDTGHDDDKPAHDVAAYLNSIVGIKGAQPFGVLHATAVRVTIGKETFLGAIYSQDRGSAYAHRRFYLLGECPLVFRKAGRNRLGESKLVFTYDGGTWYAGGGYTPYLCKPDKADFVNRFGGGDLRPFNPFGHWFDISEWPTNEVAADGKTFGEIDKWDAKPRKRFPIKVDVLVSLADDDDDDDEFPEPGATVNTGWRTITPGKCCECGESDRWETDGRGSVFCECQRCECGSEPGWHNEGCEFLKSADADTDADCSNPFELSEHDAADVFGM